MKIVICDDSFKDINYLCPIIENFFEFLNISVSIDSCNTGKELLQLTKEYQILIMDIQLKNEDGMEIVKQYHHTHPRTKVIYYSSNIEYAYQTYDAFGFGFIKKPIDVDNLYKELNRALDEFKLNELLIPDSRGINVSISKDKILYIKANLRYSSVYLLHHKIESSRSISEWAKILSTDNTFQLCRRGVLVNLYAVESIDFHDKVHLINGDVINLSEKIGQMFKEKYVTFWGNHLC